MTDNHPTLYFTFTIYFFEVIGIIKRKALIKELAAVYHAECLSYCQELLELQRNSEEVRNNAFLLVIYVLSYFHSFICCYVLLA